MVADSVVAEPAALPDLTVVALVEQGGNAGSHARDMALVLVLLSQRPKPIAGVTTDRERDWRAGLAGSEHVVDEHCDQFDHTTTQSAQLELQGTVVAFSVTGGTAALRSAIGVVVVLITSKQPAA